MELRHIRYFLAVAEELSFTKAAQRLGIAQPPLSQQIQVLESELGCELFDRTHRHIVLTHAGREFMTDAKQILEAVVRAERKVSLAKRGMTERLSIGILSSLATSEFAALLRSFRKEYPNVEVRLVEQSTLRQLDSLQNSEIDVGFSRLGFSTPAIVETYQVRSHKLRLAVPTLHPFAKKKRIEWSDLNTEPLILVDPKIASPGYYNELYDHCRDAGFEPFVQQYTSNVATQVWLVSAGLGIAPLYVGNIEAGPGVKFIDVPEPAPSYPMGLVWRKGDRSQALKNFLQFAKSSFV
ncbi:MAG: LysR family transcriptional regulator [Bdellovibrionia bacterium]